MRPSAELKDFQRECITPILRDAGFDQDGLEYLTLSADQEILIRIEVRPYNVAKVGFFIEWGVTTPVLREYDRGDSLQPWPTLDSTWLGSNRVRNSWTSSNSLWHYGDADTLSRAEVARELRTVLEDIEVPRWSRFLQDPQWMFDQFDTNRSLVMGSRGLAPALGRIVYSINDGDPSFLRKSLDNLDRQRPPDFPQPPIVIWLYKRLASRTS